MFEKSGRTWWRHSVLRAGLGLLLASSHGFFSPARAADAAYEIPVILPLTGPASFLGTAEKKSLEAIEVLLSKDGGIGGKKVSFVFYDDQSSPQTAVQLTTQIKANNPAVILGSTIAGMCNAMAPLMATGPVMYCFSPALYPKSGSFVFSSSNSTKDLLSAQLRYFKLTGKTKVGLITSTDASGQDAGRQFKALLALPEFSEVKVVVETTFNPTDVSAAAQVQRIKSAEPQAVIAWSTGAAIGTVFKAMIDVGLDLPVATTDGNMTLAQMKQYASILPKTLFIPSPEWPESDRPVPPEVAREKKMFFAALKDAGVKPDAAHTFGWDPALLVVSALKKIGPNATADQVRDYLSKLKDFAGINGVYDFEKVPQRGLDDSNVVITQWEADKETWNIISQPRGVPFGK